MKNKKDKQHAGFSSQEASNEDKLRDSNKHADDIHGNPNTNRSQRDSTGDETAEKNMDGYNSKYTDRYWDDNQPSNGNYDRSGDYSRSNQSDDADAGDDEYDINIDLDGEDADQNGKTSTLDLK